MATYTPPPYFPQSSLSPPDKGRYKKFRLILVGFAIILALLLGGGIVGLFYLFTWMF